MNKETGRLNKALQWAKQEYQTDKEYWKDRSENGLGIIQKIADFILKQAGGEVGE